MSEPEQPKKTGDSDLLEQLRGAASDVEDLYLFGNVFCDTIKRFLGEFSEAMIQENLEIKLLKALFSAYERFQDIFQVNYRELSIDLNRGEISEETMRFISISGGPDGVKKIFAWFQRLADNIIELYSVVCRQYGKTPYAETFKEWNSKSFQEIDERVADYEVQTRKEEVAQNTIDVLLSAEAFPPHLKNEIEQCLQEAHLLDSSLKSLQFWVECFGRTFMARPEEVQLSIEEQEMYRRTYAEMEHLLMERYFDGRREEYNELILRPTVDRRTGKRTHPHEIAVMMHIYFFLLDKKNEVSLRLVALRTRIQQGGSDA